MPLLTSNGSRFLGGGVRWLLRDEFTTDRAAGAVNGTAAEPGPGTRAAVDTESKLTLSGGDAVFAGQKTSAAYGDPGLWLSAFTRAAGRIFCAQVTQNDTLSKQFITGISSGQSGAVGDGFALNGNSLFLRPGTNLRVGDYAFNTDYQLAFVLRATGAFAMIKGGAFTDWTLLYPLVVGTTATVYPGLSNYNGTVRLRGMRVPDAYWLPVPLASDSFNRTDGAIAGCAASGPKYCSTSARPVG